HSDHRPTPHTLSLHPPPPPQIYTLSLHDAIPISLGPSARRAEAAQRPARHRRRARRAAPFASPSESSRRTREWRHRAPGSSVARSEEHTSELQSPDHLVCRLLLEKKK